LRRAGVPRRAVAKKMCRAEIANFFRTTFNPIDTTLSSVARRNSRKTNLKKPSSA
jgi:hypothetical protein